MSTRPEPLNGVTVENTIFLEEIRQGDPISIQIKGSSLATQPWGFNPFGCEIISASTVGQVGEVVVLICHFKNQKFETPCLIVYEIDHLDGRKICGLRFVHQELARPDKDTSRRIARRWTCPLHMLPTGSAAHPTRYNDYIFFRVFDIAPNGIRAITSLRNKLLVPGVVIEASLSIPAIGTVSARLRVRRAAVENLEGKDQLVLGLEFVKPDEILLSTLAEYLLTFASETSARSLRDEGFTLRSPLSSAFDFGYVKTKDEYREVLELRWRAYQKNNKISAGVDSTFMSDEFDSRSRILIVKHQGKIVGSVRAMFHEDQDTTSHERYLRLPPTLPPKSDCVEASRLCVDPDFRGMDIAYELVSHLVLLTIKSGKKYFFGSAADSLKSFWRSTGAEFIDTFYTHAELGNLEHEMLVSDVYDAVLGRSVSKTEWKRIYKGLYSYCIDSGLVEPTLLDVARIAIYRV